MKQVNRSTIPKSPDFKESLAFGARLFLRRVCFLFYFDSSLFGGLFNYLSDQLKLSSPRPTVRETVSQRTCPMSLHPGSVHSSSVDWIWPFQQQNPISKNPQKARSTNANRQDLQKAVSCLVPVICRINSETAGTQHKGAHSSILQASGPGNVHCGSGPSRHEAEAVFFDKFSGGVDYQFALAFTITFEFSNSNPHLSLHPSLSLHPNGVVQMLQAQNVNSRRRMRGRCGTNRRVLPCHQNTARFGQNTFFRKSEEIHRQNTPNPGHWPKITANVPPEHPKTSPPPGFWPHRLGRESRLLASRSLHKRSHLNPKTALVPHQ